MANKNWLFTSTAALILLLIILAYMNHFDNGFHFDDWHTVQENPYIKNIKNIPLFFTSSSTFSVLPQHQSYRPLLETTFAIDYWIAGGLKPFYFHMTSFLLFLLQCTLLYFIFFKVLNNDRYFALFATAVYGLHTAMAETVNYISARSDILSTGLIVLALFLYIYSKLSKKYFLYLIPAALAILTKETSLVFPLLLWAYIAFFEEHERPLWKLLWPSVLTSLAVGLLCYFMLAKAYEPSLFDRWEYILSQPYVILHYFISFILPLNLSADSDWTVVKSLVDEKVILGVIFMAASFVLIMFTAKRKNTKPVAFGLLWFFIACFPTSSGVVPLAEVVNDHRMYFPFIGLALATSWLMRSLLMEFKSSKLRWIIPVFMALFLLANAMGVRNRNKVWYSEETLWLDVTKKSPKNGRGLMNYGLTQMARGQYVIAERYFKAALKYTPYYHVLYINLGILKQAQGDMLNAEQNFVTAIKYGKNYYEPYYYYSEFLRISSRDKEQEDNLNKVIQLSPSYMRARHSLMSLYKDQKRWRELEPFARKTLVLDPGDEMSRASLAYIDKLRTTAEQLNVTLRYSKDRVGYISLSGIYYQLGDYQKSITTAQDALETYPDLDAVRKYLCLSYKAMSYDKMPKWCDRYL